MVYRNDDRRWIQINQGIHESQLYSLRISDLSQSESGWETKIKQEVADLQQSINLQEGPLLHAALFKTLTGDYLFLAIHHLVVDGVSWRILLEDLSAGYQQAAAGQTIQLPPKTDSYQEYARRIQEYAQSSKLIREEAYWRSVEEQQDAELPYEIPHQVNIDFSKRDSLNFSLTEADTAVLPRKRQSRLWHRYTRYSVNRKDPWRFVNGQEEASSVSLWKDTGENTFCQS